MFQTPVTTYTKEFGEEIKSISIYILYPEYQVCAIN